MEKESLQNPQINLENEECNDNLDEELNKASERDGFRLLPLFEKDMFDRRFIQQHSMDTNKVLRCEWEKFKETYGNKSGPFAMPNNEDMHFHNQMVKFYPTSSIKNKDHRKKMKSGPGVDFYGQKPIPNNLFMKRDSKIVTNEKFTKKHAQMAKSPKFMRKPEAHIAAGKKAGKET